jgi:molecular chaperone DnaK (HSP70)
MKRQTATTHRLAIDFGTTNSAVAQWTGSAIEVLSLSGLSQPATDTQPPLIPSLLYVQDGHGAHTVAGQAVRERGLDYQPDNRLFRNFKRGIATTTALPPRLIDGTPWADPDAGCHFLRHLLAALPYDAGRIEQLVLTAPVVTFESYQGWLAGAVEPYMPDAARLRLLDEATAAALGYAVTEPGAIVLVFDFGGGTLDLSLVKLPESQEQTGGFLGRLGGSRPQAARVIAKAGRVLGGSDIDQWLLADILRRAGLTAEQSGSQYAALLTRCEQAKIALSSQETTTVDFAAAGRDHSVVVTRVELESLLDQNGFYAAVRHVADKVMHVARRNGIFKEDIRYVLMVGGVSLMPSVQATLRRYFSDTAIRADKPFTAVVEGALQLAAGGGLDDYLLHGYGLRHLDPETGQHAYEELIPAGTYYPTGSPFEIVLGAAHPDQPAIEFVIGEISADSVALVEVRYEADQAVFVAKADQDRQQIVLVNAGSPLLVQLEPGGVPGTDRLKASFTVDAQRRLRVSVTDLKTRRKLVRDAVVATLR